MADVRGTPERLGRELSSARLAARCSLRGIAGEAEISAAYLQKLERGQVEQPSPKILGRLAAALNLDYRKLMSLAGYEMPSNRSLADPLEKRFAAAELTKSEEMAVAAFISHLVAQREAER